MHEKAANNNCSHANSSPIVLLSHFSTAIDAFVQPWNTFFPVILRVSFLWRYTMKHPISKRILHKNFSAHYFYDCFMTLFIFLVFI